MTTEPPAPAPAGIVIFGATGGTGLALARAARAAGRPVVAAVRPARGRAVLDALGVTAVDCDVMAPGGVDAVFAGRPGLGAVVSLLGGRPGDTVLPDDEGNRRVIDAARSAGVRRFVLVTSVGAGDSRPAMPPQAAAILGPIADLKTRAEDYLKTAGLDYTILRPGHLRDGPETGGAVLSANPLMAGAISRDELGRALLAVLTGPRFVGGTYAIADRSCVAPQFSPGLVAP